MRKVLVVEDDWDMREALRDTLESAGYDSAEAGDGGAALAWLASHPPPGVILLDWNMAPMNGPQFMAELKRLPSLASIPVFLVTADARVEEKANGNGFAGYLRKPLDIDALFAIVARCCG
jgi:CheY-like chemotaxis protein